MTLGLASGQDTHTTSASRSSEAARTGNAISCRRARDGDIIHAPKTDAAAAAGSTHGRNNGGNLMP
ncbi:MAG: hypothetical protein ACJ8D8_22120, partial [Microvirga sp.]